MPSRRYTILIADRSTGAVRRVTISVRPAVAAACAIVTLPVLIGIGAIWKGKADVTELRASYSSLESENANYRAATEVLADQIEALQSTVTDLGNNAALDPAVASAIEKLPALVKARAMGGPLNARDARGRDTARQQSNYAKTLSALASPEDTFGLLRTLLEGLESRLDVVRGNVEKRNALAAATPSIWPSHGWLSSRMGYRTDPINGGADFHAGLDITGDKGQPVYATADGKVTQRGYQSAYGNLVVIDHGFGLVTKYGHLSSYTVKQGDTVKRGDVIGRVGNTGRATGYHLHYEVLANGRLLNPLQLLTQQKPRDR
jgi:murein DD-endopeptidase MepM/ murein hydrolase activator NlpD